MMQQLTPACVPAQPLPALMLASLHAFHQQDLGTTIEEVVLGAGPCGELRYPVGGRFDGVDWRGVPRCHDAALPPS